MTTCQNSLFNVGTLLKYKDLYINDIEGFGVVIEASDRAARVMWFLLEEGFWDTWLTFDYLEKYSEDVSQCKSFETECAGRFTPVV